MIGVQCPNCGYREPPPYDAELGAKLRRMREKAGLSLWQLGKLSGQSPSMLGMIERGERKARRRVVDPALLVLRERARALQEAMSALHDKDAEAENSSPLCVREEGEVVPGGKPAELPAAG